MRIIADSGSPDIFALVPGTWSTENPDDPAYHLSWLPKYNQASRYSRPFCGPNMVSTFAAAGGAPYQPRKHSESSTLVARGKILDRIEWLCPLNFEKAYYYDGMPKILQLDEHVNQVRHHFGFRDCPQPATSQLAQNLRSAVMRTLLSDGANDMVQQLPLKMEEYLEMYGHDEELCQLRDRIVDRRASHRGGCRESQSIQNLL
ncbi:hypothetical protein NA57DRAFT_56838 [Rhizodiscina lignyota]|uniref:Uncharacterized protein n=1 Tax=Rhizodiscina lignyota TaxID=1504668 RepID=A0A9P4IE61_9PEZI|nr:hypothetical protein NA57DRAFT_56838 [Rhizodiscina lignyota]